MPEETWIAPLARQEGEPAFDEPWQAQVLALAEALADRGVFARSAWSEALGAELRDAAARGESQDANAYYVAALAALEKLVAAEGRITPRGLARRVEDWRAAYLDTPHGQPVELRMSGLRPSPSTETPPSARGRGPRRRERDDDVL